MIHVVQCIGFHTLQDDGRKGYREYGIPESGAMDTFAYEVGNLLLGNERKSSLEISFGKISLKFDTETLISLTGFGVGMLNGNQIPTWRAVRIQKNDVLELHTHPMGNFSYLSIQGGFEAEQWLGSGSTYVTVVKGGMNGRILEKGDVLKIQPIEENICQHFMKYLQKQNKIYDSWGIGPSVYPKYFSEEIRVIRGYETDFFDEDEIEELTQKPLNFSREMNRMAILIPSFPVKKINKNEISSVAVQKGTVQITPDQTAYVLMADAQTTGGYPRIGQIAEVDLSVVAQMRSSHTFRWKWIPVEEAIRLSQAQRSKILRLKMVLRERYASYIHLI